ncbi:MAG: ABC transporter ATP-binding protein [bacterium]|nr:ABC transporter ATP-binding protein [bacterium]
MAENVLEVKNLVKNYGDFRAVDDVSFSVPRGRVVGFLGPNGAGKTTTIHVLLGITERSGGTIRYFGDDFTNHRLKCLQRINAASAFNTLLGRITVMENLLVFADLYEVPNARQKIAELLERFEMSHTASSQYWNLSAGQRTRINLVKSLLNDPEILLMDEPTASLDPDIADKTLSIIEELKRERGLSILFTSHNMSEITRICDEVIFLDRGRIVAHDTPRNLVKRITAATLRVAFASDAKEVIEEYLRGQKQNFKFADRERVEIFTEENRIPELLFGMSHTGSRVVDIEIVKPTLEDVFLQIARTRI